MGGSKIEVRMMDIENSFICKSTSNTTNTVPMPMPVPCLYLCPGCVYPCLKSQSPPWSLTEPCHPRSPWHPRRHPWHDDPGPPTRYRACSRGRSLLLCFPIFQFQNIQLDVNLLSVLCTHSSRCRTNSISNAAFLENSRSDFRRFPLSSKFFSLTE